VTSRFPTLTPARRALRLTPPSGTVDVVIDTDATNEIDDEFAVVWSLLRPDRLRVRGLVASPYGYSRELLASGLVLPELDARRLSRRLAAAGVDVARIPTFDPADGMRRAHAELVRILELARDCGVPCDAQAHPGADRYLPAPDEPVDSPGVRFLIETAHATENRPLYVVAIGCATNVASALLLDPSLVERIVVVWTAAYPSFWPGVNASYNLAQDVPAARVLLESGVPLVYLPGYYVGEELRVSRAEISAHVAGRGPLGEYLHGLYERHPRGGHALGQSKVLWDLINIAWLLEPSWFSVHTIPTPSLDAELRWVAHGPERHTMLEAIDVDRDEIFADLYGCLEEHSVKTRADPDAPADAPWDALGPAARPPY
jgi:hypothetical protein